MLRTIKNLLKSFHSLHLSNESKRKKVLLGQYYRAIALPDWGFRTWKFNQKPNENIDISVIITSYNYAFYIEDCINSVLNAAKFKPEIEIVVIDDASTDDSLNKIKQFIQYSPVPALVMRTWWNVGVSRARNLAISQARGQFVFILDADNTLFPSALRDLHVLSKNSSADATYGIINRIKIDGSSDGIVSNRDFNHQILLTKGNYIDAMALFNTQKLLELGGYNIHLLKFIGGWEDYALWLELGKRKCNIQFLNRKIGTYLVKNQSMVKSITTNEMIAFREYAKANYPGFNAFSNLK